MLLSSLFTLGFVVCWIVPHQHWSFYFLFNLVFFIWNHGRLKTCESEWCFWIPFDWTSNLGKTQFPNLPGWCRRILLEDLLLQKQTNKPNQNNKKTHTNKPNQAKNKQTKKTNTKTKPKQTKPNNQTHKTPQTTSWEDDLSQSRKFRKCVVGFFSSLKCSWENNVQGHFGGTNNAE